MTFFFVVACVIACVVGFVLFVLARERRNHEAIVARHTEDPGDGPIVKLVQRTIEDAYARGAAAIHITPGASAPGPGALADDTVRVRYRIDGALEERMRLPRKALDALIDHLGRVAGLPPLPPARLQEGRFSLRPHHPGTLLDLDLHVARWSSPDGPHAVLRLLPRGPVELDLEGVDLAPGPRDALQRELERPQGGVILVAGLARSGRTTTLYALRRAVDPTRAIVHVGEDEYFPSVQGVDTRSAWHLDADVLVVGELHDEADARLAFQAAQDGRLVLATLFAEDVGMAIARLVDDLHVSRHVLAVCLRAVVAQRLVRRVCRGCKAPAELPPEVRDAGITTGECFAARPGSSCELCGGAGYKGRAAIHEVALVAGELEAALRRGESSAPALQRAALASGMTPLLRDGLLKVSLGKTDLPAVHAALGAAVAGAPTADGAA